MSLDKALKNLKFDKRLTEYNLNKNLLTKEELAKHLQSLEDVGHKVDLVRLGSNVQDRDSYN
jgi:tripartite-type tricarboxylate transporter receptor subunit TctC